MAQQCSLSSTYTEREVNVFFSLYKFRSEPLNVRSETLNDRSEPLNVRSKPLNVRSEPLNGDFNVV